MRLTKSGTRPCGLPCGGEQARTASPSDRDFVKRRIGSNVATNHPQTLTNYKQTEK